MTYREPSGAPSLRTELLIVLLVVALAIPGIALMRWYIDWAAADVLLDPPVQASVPTLECRAPTEYELLVSTAAKPGYAVAEEAGYAVAVTTEITPALADEGLARELVRRIQEMRKSAGLDIADRIRLSYEGDAEVVRVIEAWRGYIGQETLAATISAGVSGRGYVEEQEIDGRTVRLAVERV